MEEINLHQRSDLHLLRKTFHICFGIALLYPLWYEQKSREWMAAFLGTLLALVMSIEYMRSHWKEVNQWMVRIMGPVMRESEVTAISGIPFYLGSFLFSVLVFPEHITIIAMLHLIFGDPSSSFFGVLWGRDKLFPHKSLQGALGGFAVCTTTTALYLHIAQIGDGKIVILSIIGGLAGAIAELLPLNIDDNFSIPVVSGGIISLTFWCGGIVV